VTGCAGPVDDAQVVELHGDAVLVGRRAWPQVGDRPRGAAADVGVGVAGWVEFPVGDAGDEAVTDAVATVGGGHLVGADIAGGTA
jgi:hypothetical protein